MSPTYYGSHRHSCTENQRTHPLPVLIDQDWISMKFNHFSEKSKSVDFIPPKFVWNMEMHWRTLVAGKPQGSPVLIPQDSMGELSTYLSKSSFDCLRVVFSIVVLNFELSLIDQNENWAKIVSRIKPDQREIGFNLGKIRTY